MLIIIFHISEQELDINKLYSCENLMQKWFYIPVNMINLMRGSSCSSSYGSWIYNCICNQCLSPLRLWVRIPLLSKTKHTSTDKEGPQGRDRMVILFTTTYVCIQSVSITTHVVRTNPAYGEVYLIKHHVIQCVSDLRQVGGFLLALRFPQPIKLTSMI